jgi:hypothetical protein
MLSRKDFESSFLPMTRQGDEYVVNLSSNVCIKMNTSFNTEDKLVKITSILWSKPLNRVINAKDYPKVSLSSPNLVQGIVAHWDAIYTAKSHFYEKQIHMTTEELQKYQIEMSIKIQSIADWDKSDFLKDTLENVNKGVVLSDKVLACISKPLSVKSKVLSDEQIKFQNKITALCNASQAKGDEWTYKFSSGILEGIKKFGTKASFTERQKEIIAQKLTKYNIL